MASFEGFSFPLSEMKYLTLAKRIRISYNRIAIQDTDVFTVICSKNENQLVRNNVEDYISNKDFWHKDEVKKIIKMCSGNGKNDRIFEWILSRIVIKYCLQLYMKELDMQFNVIFKDFNITTDSNNRPIIENSVTNNKGIPSIFNPFLSISHTKKKIFIAFCLKPVGIDVELILKHSPSWEEKIHTQDSLNQLKGIFYNQNIDSMETIDTIIWAIKESTLKMIGNLPLGIIPEIPIFTEKIKDHYYLITKHPYTEDQFFNYISIDGDSVYAITLSRNP